MNDLPRQFKNPGAEWRGKPFWSWNGELREEELLRQIHVMRDMGLGGFFMHSRTGLMTEYLGEEWFRLTNVCADEAQRLGMEAWLYDEDRWPSGTAGGLVTVDPAFRMRFLRLRPVPGGEFQWCDCLLAAFACRLEGTAYQDCERLTPETPKEAFREKTVLSFSLELMEPSSFYNGYTYVDTLCREATEHYIQLTHAQYQAHCGSRLGAAIQGIFTDEPHRGPVMTGFGLPNEGRLWMTPWTEALPARFQEQFGQDLIARLPELFLFPDGEAISPVKWQYMELLQRMFLENFARPLYDWCEAHDLRLTGHALHEDSLTSQAAMQGSLMRFYEYMHAPGVDVLTENNRNPLIVKQLTSAARQLGKTWLLSELYGCTGWQMNFRNHKEAGDWQALLGINLRCHHLSWYTMEGEAKRDYPASILHQSSWWQEYGYVESYFARLGLLLGQGEPQCEILVINPVESLWCQIGVGWAEGLSPKTRALQELEAAYAELSDWLLRGHLDFDYGDEEMMSRLAHTERSAGGEMRLHMGRMSYRAVIVPRMTTMRASTLRLLDEFSRQGGTVLFAGEPPTHLDAVPSPTPAALAERAARLPWDAHSLIAACRTAIPPSVQIQDAETGETLTDIFCQVRMDGDKRTLVVLNMNRAQGHTQARIRLWGQGAVEEWDCRSGERYAVPARSDGGWTEFLTDFAPSGERAYIIGPQQNETRPPRPSFQEAGRAACEGPYEYTLSEENVCVLDFARWRLNDGPWQAEQEILKVDQAVRQALGMPQRGGEMVQPWFRRKQRPPRGTAPRLEIALEFFIQEMPTGPVHLALERPERWEVRLNGTRVPSHSLGWWVDAAFQKIVLPASAFLAGRNELTLETDFWEETNLEALYLLGDFGVFLNGTRKTLGHRPARLEGRDIVPQGFPFYGGPLTYHLALPPHGTGRDLRLRVPSFEAACLRAGSAMIAFPPFQAEVVPTGGKLDLEVALTRRNTFGPLHQVPLRVDGYGPGNFITEGADFSAAYMLYPAGLLEPPVLVWSA